MSADWASPKASLANKGASRMSADWASPQDTPRQQKGLSPVAEHGSADHGSNSDHGNIASLEIMQHGVWVVLALKMLPF